MGLPSLPSLKPNSVSDERWLKIRAYTVVLGGFLILFVLGSHYTFSNMNSYIASYIRARVNPEYTYADGPLIFAGNQVTHGVGMILGGYIEYKFGPKPAALLGVLIFCGGVVATAWSVTMSGAMVVVTYGLMYGFGKGVAYVVPLAVGMKWFPNNKGLVNGVVLSAYGLGSMTFNTVQTSFVNPDNVKPVKTPGSGDDKYFVDENLLNRVPTLFLVMGGAYIIIQIIGVILMSKPPKVEEAEELEQAGEMDTTVDEPMRRSRASDFSNPDAVRRASVAAREAVAARGKGETGPEDPRSPGSPRTSGPPRSSQDPDKSPRPSKSTSAEDGDDQTAEGQEAGEGAAATGDVSLSPKQVLRAYEFYMLWFTFFFNQQGIGYISTLYKQVGNTTFSDDRFMVMVSNSAMLLNSFGRPVWGTIQDKFTYRVAMMIAGVIFSTLLATFPFSLGIGKYAFMAWVMLLFFCMAATQALLPGATSQCFGPTFAGSNYGMVFVATMVSQPLQSVITKQLKSRIGYDWLSRMNAILVAIPVLISFMFHKKPHPSIVRKRLGLPATD